jgi:hypothetical protein
MPAHSLSVPSYQHDDIFGVWLVGLQKKVNLLFSKFAEGNCYASIPSLCTTSIAYVYLSIPALRGILHSGNADSEAKGDLVESLVLCL